ncbi:MAG: putative NAD(P)H nitroreductase [Candidatus Omnitrophica bacterium ADurb.Bin205]|nr:MAG: putative NAD(P)H nitroreductase [Candidatus Omnitrophica bacterium ADurb.Bin205]
MDAIEVLKKRRSIRVFQQKPILKDQLEAVVDAGRFAPTARNLQPWEFVIITQKRVLSEIAKLAENGRFIQDCAACIAVFSSDTKYYLEDGCAATVNMLNAAAALGIGSCWVAGDKKSYCQDISRILNAKNNLKLVSLIALGYPKEDGAFGIVEKKRLGEILHWEKF